jgi:hypothetical protein
MYCFVMENVATETAEKFEFFLSGLSVLCGEKGFVLSQLDTSAYRYCTWKRSVL